MSEEGKIKELINEGYNIFRCVWNKETRSNRYIPCSINLTYLRANFNVLENGGLDVRFVKDRDFKNQIIFGLDIKDEKPSFSYPENYPRSKRVFDRNELTVEKLKEMKELNLSTINIPVKVGKGCEK